MLRIFKTSLSNHPWQRSHAASCFTKPCPEGIIEALAKLKGAIMKRRFLLLTVLGLTCFIQTANPQAKKSEEYGYKIGQKMPFHVVDFFAGARTTGGGCPSVMNSNGKAKGVE